MDDPTTLIAGSTALIIGFICLSFIITGAFTVGLTLFIRSRLGPNKKVLKNGISGEATIQNISQTGMMVNYQPQVKLDLEVRIPGWAPYITSMKTVIAQVQIPQFQPGMIIPVKVDPNQKDKIAIG